MKNRIFICADGGELIGLGHIVRTVALAHMLKSDFEIIFYIPLKSGMAANLVESEGFRCNKYTERHEFITSIEGDTIVVLDGYVYDLTWQREIKDRGAILCCIDDLCNEYYADLIINQSPAAKDTDYNVSKATELLLGPRYALLRPAFLTRARNIRQISSIETVIICFGGADPQNLTEQTLNQVLRYSSAINKVIVITGKAYRNVEDLQQLVGAHNLVQHFHDINDESVASLLEGADMAIVPASGILIEALSMSCVVVSGYYVDNQMRNYMGFLETGAIVGVWDFSENKMEDVLSELIYNRKIPTAPRLIDGQSGVRIRHAFVRINVLKHMKVRRAEATDCGQYFEWANDNSVRRNSISTGEISWESHVKWFQAKMEDPNSCLLIFESERLPVGQVRFDLQNGEWLISFSIAVNYRDMGLARPIVARALSTLREMSELPFLAFVKHENVASSKIFKGLNFELVSKPEDEYLKFSRKY